MFLYNEKQTEENGFTVGHLDVSFVGIAVELENTEKIDHDLVLQVLASNSMYGIFKEGLRSVCRKMEQRETERRDNIEKWDRLVWGDPKVTGEAAVQDSGIA